MASEHPYSAVHQAAALPAPLRVPGMSDQKIKDGMGQEIRVGDILLSASKTGNIKIGRVERMFPSGRITIKYADKINIYAYEEGAPDIPYQSTRAKRDANGEVIYMDHPSGYKDWRGVPYKQAVQEEYTAYKKDHTVVGRRWRWKQEEAAHYARFVVKSTEDHPLFNLDQFLGLDYEADAPELD